MALQRKRVNLSVGKRYNVIHLLGKGSFSTVYLAYHRTFGNKVALKIIDRANIKEEYVSRNLYREAHILMKLKHPNIVSFYEEILHYDLYCLSMEYICGVDLCQYLKNQTFYRVSERTAKLLFYQMVSAVNHMHQLNVLHRDLKQENIMIEFGRIIKIVDFGLSNEYQPTLQLRTHCGSLVYAAPELFEHHNVYGPAVDLWSLGVILYSMVTGRMPFELSKNMSDESASSRMDCFHKKISKGLTQEHWIIMGKLSSDCCHLVENLLQPDQFKRIKIKGAILHPWFESDAEWKKRLPQERTDLKRKFEPEIKNFMADYMGISIQRVHNHVTHFRFSKISAIYFIARDILIKEILYPPHDVENSFIYKFECWRKRVLGPDSNESEEFEDESFTELEDDQQDFRSNVPVSQGFDNTGKGCYPVAESKFHSNGHNAVFPQNVANVRKGTRGVRCFTKRDPSLAKVAIPDGAKQNMTEPGANLKIPRQSGDNMLISQRPMTGQPFRSYKSNRPTKFLIQRNSNTENLNVLRNQGDYGKAQTHEEPPQRTNAPKMMFDFSGSLKNQQTDTAPFNESFNAKCKINSHQIAKQSKDERNEVHHPSNKVQSETTKVKTLRLPEKQLKKQNPKQSFSINTGYMQSSGDMSIPGLYKPKLNDKEPLKRSSFNEANRSYNPPENVYVNQDELHQHQKQEGQCFPQKQKSMTIKRSYQIPSATFRNSKLPVCNFQYGPPSTFVQAPAFGMNPRNTKEQKDKFHRFHMETQSKLLECHRNNNFEKK